MKSGLIYVIAAFAIFSIFLSIMAGLDAREYDRQANFTNQKLMLVYPLHLMRLEMGLENEEPIFEEVEILIDECDEYNLKSIKAEAKERLWRLSFEIFIISLMLILVSLSIITKKQKELKHWVKGTFGLSLGIAFFMFCYPFFI